MNVSVHRFVAGWKASYRDGIAFRRLHNLAFACQPFKVSTVLIVVSVLLQPAKSFLRERERALIFGGLIGSGCAVEPKTDPVEMFAVSIFGGRVDSDRPNPRRSRRIPDPIKCFRDTASRD